MNEYKQYPITQEMTTGLCTLIIHNNSKYNSNNLQIQIILRNYTSISQIVHGFDISACSVAYDGTYTYFTKMGAWSYLTKLIVVWPEYRSTTYESRLVKYWNKGYGIVFPHMLEFTPNMELPHLLINIQYYSGNFAYGNIFLAHDNKQSDYSIQDNLQSIQMLNYFNTIQIIQNSNMYKVSGNYYPNNYSQTTKLNFKNLRSCITLNQLGFSSIKFKQILDEILYNGIHIKQRKIFIDFYILQNVLLFNHIQINKIIELAIKYNKILIDNPFKKYTLNYTQLQFKIEEFMEKYENVKNTEIKWWIPFDQNKPFTSSLNPIIEEPKDWYGKVLITDVNNRITSPNSNNNNYKSENDIICSCCLSAIIDNDFNIIKLQCGHLFHYSEDIECSCIGVKLWINVHNKCPNCRSTVIFQDEKLDLII